MQRHNVRKQRNMIFVIVFVLAVNLAPRAKARDQGRNAGQRRKRQAAPLPICRQA